MLRRSLLSFGLFILIAVWTLSACTPPPGATVDAKGDWESGGTCMIDESGWTLAWDESKSRMDLGFWLIGDCDYAEEGNENAKR